MELLKMTSKSVITKMGSLDCPNDCNSRNMLQAVRDFPPGCGINEDDDRKPLKALTKAHSDIGKMRFDENETKPKKFSRNNSFVVPRPSGKVKFWDPTSTKAGFDEKPKVTTTVRMQEGKVIKNSSNDDLNVRNMTPSSEDKLDNLVNSRVDDSKVKSFELKELGRRSYLDTRSAGKVKFWDPTCEAQKSEDTTTVVSIKEKIRREKIKEAIAVFDEVYELFSQENKKKADSQKIPPSRVPMEVAKIVKQKLKWMDPEKIAGSVCGVQIGDNFKYRSQLMMVGLHSQPHSGIDYVNNEGMNLAISIVDSHRYSNESGSSDTLIYSGQGGNNVYGSKVPPEDQQLVRGNMAMKNSMGKKNPVRVIRKIAGFGKDVFVYEGLYTVDNYTKGKNAEGKIVFKFHLKRVPGQPSLHNMMNSK